MASKLTSLCLAFALAVIVGQSHAINLIELTDANQAILNLELSKALGGIQAAFKNDFKFDTVKQVRKFLEQCEYVKATIASAKDSAYEGMAKQIKDILAEPSIKSACSVSSAQIDESYDPLDDLSMGDTIHAPLSTSVYNLLVELNEKVNGDSNLRTAIGHLVKRRTEETAEGLLNGAPHDIEILVGETHESKGLFNFETTYRKFCEISLIAPICKLVRGTNLEVSAIAADVNKFAQQVQANDVAENTQKSGVTMEELKENCGKLRRSLRPVEQINKYLSAGLINEEQFKAHRVISPELDSYVALFDLCQLVNA